MSLLPSLDNAVLTDLNPMQTAQQAETLILETISPIPECESVSLLNSLGRVLAEDICSSLDFPHWDNSAMDGYAVKFADVANANEQTPTALQVVAEIPAGTPPQLSLQTGQAARIFTGAMMPAGADTVVMQEQTQREGDRILILAAPKPAEFVRQQGSFHRAGEVLLKAGIRLTAPDIAILAAAQCSQVSVFRQPRVAILSTGDELVTPDQPLQPGQLVDSNQYALAALVQQSGAIPLCFGIVPDQPEALKAAIAQAMNDADLILSSGGVSVGDYDYVDQILSVLGGTIHLRSVAVKPGKPLTVATLPRLSEHQTPAQIPYVGLPGNPVSALVTFWRFVQPALKKLSGLQTGWLPKIVQGRSRQPLKSGGKRETYLWGRVDLSQAIYEFDLAGGSHSSGNLINLAQTNALAIVPIGQTAIAPGDPLQIMLLPSD